MKKLVFFVLAISLSIFILKTGNSLLLAESAELTYPLLSSSEWGTEDFNHGLHISFNDGDKTYTKSMQGPGGEACSGPYELKKGKLYLLKPKEGVIKKNGVVCKPMECTFKISSTSLYHTHNLRCGKDESYWLSLKKLPAGTKRYIGKIPVVTMGYKTGTVKYNMKMRLGPSVSHGVNKCSIFTHDGGGKTKKADLLQKGDFVHVIARTVEESKVGKYNGYWYYVDLGLYDKETMSCEKDKAWLYGPLIELE